MALRNFWNFWRMIIRRDGEENNDEDGDDESQADPEESRRREANPETAVADDFSKCDLSVGEAFGGNHLLDVLIIDGVSRHVGELPLKVFDL